LGVGDENTETCAMRQGETGQSTANRTYIRRPEREGEEKTALDGKGGRRRECVPVGSSKRRGKAVWWAGEGGKETRLFFVVRGHCKDGKNESNEKHLQRWRGENDREKGGKDPQIKLNHMNFFGEGQEGEEG